ncbi:MAG: patatin-like phospholipase family protein [Pseudomonadota bacterium]
MQNSLFQPVRALGRTTVLLMMLLVAGCASMPRDSFTLGDQQQAEVSGFSNIRHWADASADELARISPVKAVMRSDRRTPAQMLALSGGGGAGAYGAGLLVGWTNSNKRPAFDVVTGVSAGALIAPFAFLGSRYDPQLRSLFTSGIAKDLNQRRGPIRALISNGASDNSNFRKLIARYVTPDVVFEIARAHANGRRLLVVTTNLDAQRAMVWDIGAIAMHANIDKSMHLIHQVLLASASVPGVFPAVKISAVANGQEFSELHSDGGVATQIYTAPEVVLAGGVPKPTRTPHGSRIYMIVNNTIDPEFSVVKATSLSIASRAYSTFIKSHTRQTISQTYNLSRKTGLDFNLSYIEEKVPYDATDPFNTKYMRRLFDIGYATGNRDAWKKTPPILTSVPVENAVIARK